MNINGKHISASKIIYLVIYYSFARFLPESDSRLGKLILSKKIRRALCKRIFKKCGMNVNIERLAFFGTGCNLELGDNSGIGINADIPSDTKIGKNVMMGPNCKIFAVNHIFSRTDIPMCEQGQTPPLQCIIEDDVWIGQDVMIMPGKIIRKGSIVAAGCILSKSFPEYSVIGGNPPVILKSRLQKGK